MEDDKYFLISAILLALFGLLKNLELVIVFGFIFLYVHLHKIQCALEARKIIEINIKQDRVKR